MADSGVALTVQGRLDLYTQDARRYQSSGTNHLLIASIGTRLRKRLDAVGWDGLTEDERDLVRMTVPSGQRYELLSLADREALAMEKLTKVTGVRRVDVGDGLTKYSVDGICVRLSTSNHPDGGTVYTGQTRLRNGLVAHYDEDAPSKARAAALASALRDLADALEKGKVQA